MRLNRDTVLLGERAALVPYSAEHVPRYHEWMKSEELQKLTASEPLTLQQEYEMQRSWREDADKCTFIILDRMKRANDSSTEEDCMVGDVNLFLTDPEDPTVAEIEIMIAEPSYRGKGFGKEVTMMMMHYGIIKLGITKFQAKIGLENKISIGMFRRFHFEEISISDVFQEMTLLLTVDDCRRKWLLEQMSYVEEKLYSKMKC
ncbi:N-acetyltransferase 9 [Callorhinchus milii]|uniref:Alpha/beta-tubulin-N-acetyltransferase 9 n=1 Tax=Callorhinchus milii TaxID=7868 RepID=V9L5H0_CALMI|nr:N-acetyltransferase 9 [Callorhinchus milii]|eukprot:gi/632942915/ref/XP_007886684.1/ PREDICTED: N-acetyltransferase 9 [Callorhinchus milii]